MYCKKCGIENNDNANFCRGCGNDLQNKKNKSEGKKGKRSKGIRFLVVLISFAAVILIALITIASFSNTESLISKKETINSNSESTIIEKETTDNESAAIEIEVVAGNIDPAEIESMDVENSNEFQAKIASAINNNSKIALIMWSKYHSGWDEYYQGAREAGEKYGMEVEFYSPTITWDSEQQLRLMMDALSDDVDAICISPIDDEVLKIGYDESARLNIPVINTLANRDPQIAVSKVCLDYYNTGEIAAHEMARKLGGIGKVAIIYTSLIDNIAIRTDGFTDTMKMNYPNIEIAYTQDTMGTASQAEVATKRALETISAIDGIYGADNDCVEGMISAVNKYSESRDYVLIGGDGGGNQKEYVSSGKITGMVFEDLHDAGYKAIETAALYVFDIPVDEVVLYRGIWCDINSIEYVE